MGRERDDVFGGVEPQSCTCVACLRSAKEYAPPVPHMNPYDLPKMHLNASAFNALPDGTVGAVPPAARFRKWVAIAQLGNAEAAVVSEMRRQAGVWLVGVVKNMEWDRIEWYLWEETT